MNESRDERIEGYYHQSAWDLAEQLVDAQDEIAKLKAELEDQQEAEHGCR